MTFLVFVNKAELLKKNADDGNDSKNAVLMSKHADELILVAIDACPLNQQFNCFACDSLAHLTCNEDIRLKVMAQSIKQMR